MKENSESKKEKKKSFAHFVREKKRRRG